MAQSGGCRVSPQAVCAATFIMVNMPASTDAGSQMEPVLLLEMFV